MKNNNAKFLCLVLALVLVLSVALVACDDSPSTPTTPEQPQVTPLIQRLTVSLKAYIASDEFSTAKSIATTQARVPLMYSRYIKGDVYTEADAESFKTNLEKIDSVIDDSDNLSDLLYEKDDCSLYTKEISEWDGKVYKNGWQSILDYAYSWSLLNNQYKQYLKQTGKADTSFDRYVKIIVNYVTEIDSSTSYYGTAYGYDQASCIVLTLENLGFSAKTLAPTSYNALLSYYDKDENDDFTKYLGNPNWVGFSGRPLANGSLMKGEEKYSLVYEKTMQGIYPYDDTKADAYYNYNIDDMINLDRLYDDYGKEIVSQYGSIGDSRYGILYGYLNGIDMTKYTKSVDDGKIYNVVQKWVDTLEKDENGNYILADIVDMAVATAYVAYESGISAPTPVGNYDGNWQIISL